MSRPVVQPGHGAPSRTPSPSPGRGEHTQPDPGRGEPDWTALLLHVARVLRLTDNPRFRRLLQNILIRRNQTAAKKLMQRLAPAYYAQQIAPDQFLSAETDLDGEFVIGTTDDGRELGLSRDEITRHVAVFGQSGTGKTTLMIRFFLQAKALGVPAIFFDRKGDCDHLARRGVLVLHWSQFAENVLCPPHCQASIVEWRNDLVKLTAEVMKFLERGSSVFIAAVDRLYEQFGVYDGWRTWGWQTRDFPSLQDLLAVLQSKTFGEQIRGQGKDSLFGIIEKLQALLIALGPVTRYQRGPDIGAFIHDKRAVAINLDGLPVEYQNFLIAVTLLRYAHFFKTFGPRGQLNLCVLIDEAKPLVGKANQNSLLIADLVSKIREWGIGLIIGDQISSEIAQFLFSNIGTLVMFRCSDGNDLQRLRYSSGATVEQSLANYALQPGQAIVRFMRSKDLHRATVPFEPVDKFIPREELDRLMAPRLAELHADVIPARAAATATIAPSRTPTPNRPPRLVLDADERCLLESVARDPDRSSSDVYKELGNPSKAFRTKQRLVAKGYISEVPTTLGKGGKRAIYLVPDPVVFAELGIPLGPGRGKALHKHFQAEFKAQAERLGFTASIEDGASSTPAAPDLAVRKPGLQVAVEISITSKPSTEAQNIEKNISLGFDRVILTFISKHALEKARAIATERYPAEVLERVTFCLVNAFTQAIEGL